MIHIKSINCRGGSMWWQLKCTTIISFRRDKYEQKETNKQTIAILRISKISYLPNLSHFIFLTIEPVGPWTESRWHYTQQPPKIVLTINQQLISISIIPNVNFTCCLFVLIRVCDFDLYFNSYICCHSGSWFCISIYIYICVWLFVFVLFICI